GESITFRASSAWRKSAGAVADLLFPPACTLCQEACESRLDSPLFCPACDRDLAICSRPLCPRCAQVCSEADAAQGNCGECRGRKLLYESVRTIGPYQLLLRQAV